MNRVNWKNFTLESLDNVCDSEYITPLSNIQTYDDYSIDIDQVSNLLNYIKEFQSINFALQTEEFEKSDDLLVHSVYRWKDKHIIFASLEYRSAKLLFLIDSVSVVLFGEIGGHELIISSLPEEDFIYFNSNGSFSYLFSSSSYEYNLNLVSYMTIISCEQPRDNEYGQSIYPRYEVYESIANNIRGKLIKPRFG